MASLVAALDKITNLRKGENGHTEYQWTGVTDMQEKIVQFHFQLVRADKFKMDELAKKFHEMLRELGFIRETVPENDRIDMICSLFCMLGQTRDIVAGKGEYALSYMMLYELSVYYPEMAAYALEQFVIYDMTDDTETNVDSHPYGSWKDLKYLAAYCKQKSHRYDHILIKKCIELTNQQLHKDMACTDDAELSLCAKWVPRECSQFGWLFKLLAKECYRSAGFLDTAKDSVTMQKAEKKCYSGVAI